MLDQISKPILLDPLVATVLKHCAGDPARAPASSTGASQAETQPTVEGPVDWTGLLQRHASRSQFVDRLVRVVLESHADTPMLLRRLAAEGDIVSIGEKAHALKGMAANLMAGETEALAQKTQQAALQQQQQARSLALELATALESMINACNEHLQQSATRANA